MEEKRTLIETFLPVEEISAEAKKEKKGRAPTFELHYWWTRKPLVAARATVLGALLPENFDPVIFKQLLGLGKKKRSHNYDIKSSQIKMLKEDYEKIWGNKIPMIFDPFSGGGSIPFEAVRCGCDTLSNDYNPVAFLIQKATIEYPMKYGDKLLEDVEKGLKWVFDNTKKELGEFYPKHNGKEVAAYIWSWAVVCPECGFKSPLVGQWWLYKSKQENIYLNPIIDDNDNLKFELKNGKNAPKGNVSRGRGKCLKCGVTIPNKIIKKQILEKDEEMLLAVVLLNDTGKSYDLPIESDFDAVKRSREILNQKWDYLLKNDLIPNEEMPHDLRRFSSKAYLKYWYRILNPRQRLLFSFLIESIIEYGELTKKIKSEEYAQAVTTYLSFILGKHINYNCRATTWTRSAQKIANALANRGIAMMWDHAEVNPFVKTSGSFFSVNRTILRSLKYSIEKMHDQNVIIENNSFLESELKASIIITDPPYFDDVPYPELSEFFYTFEKRALKKTFELPNSVPVTEDLSVGGKRTNDDFEHLFSLACKRMHANLENNGLLVMYFAHSSIKAWDFVLNSLKEAKFRITATWPIHTESQDNPIARGRASIMSSIVIVARKRKEDKTGYIEEIKGDVEEHLKLRLQEFWDYGLRGADITVAAMGATLDILTQYSEIKSYTGEMTVKDILELVEIYVVEYILEKFLKNSEILDSPTRFYIYCRLSELDGMSFDTANLISKSLNIDLKLLESNGNISSITSGRNKGIKLLKFDERDDIEVKNLIDAVQLGMLAYDKGGMREFESVLTDIPYSQGEVYNILESFKHLDSGDSEKQIALQILGKSADIIPEKGQTTLDQ